MSNKITIRNVLRSIMLVITIIEGIILYLLNNKNPFYKFADDSLVNFIFKVITVIFIFFVIAIVIYIIEHIKNNKDETILNEEEIPEKFDSDLIKNKDIIYLSTILNQKYPNKKEIVLLIMQLINKKAIDLTMLFDGVNHKYIIERRKNVKYYLNDVEEELINNIFIDCDRVDLMETIEGVYRKRESRHILEKCRKYIERNISICKSKITFIYKIIAYIILLLLLFLLWFIFILSGTTIAVETKNLGTSDVIIFFISIGIICLLLNFGCISLLKKVNMKYQYDNDSFLWVLRVVDILGGLLIISYFFNRYEIIQFVFISVYIIAMLINMIKYNTHISLNEEQLELRKELIAIKNYLIKMDYLKDKEFGNIITYEEYITYAFLFNITIKINSEFDIMQREIKTLIEKECKSYWSLLNGTL